MTDQDRVAADAVVLIAQFMHDCNSFGVSEAGENLVRAIKARIAEYKASEKPE